MKITRTQPLEHATPVVPETRATTEDDEPGATPPAAARPAADGSTTGPDGSTGGQVDETYPETPNGSAGHP